MKRFVVEGFWSGYHAGQGHVCYREVVKTSHPERYEAVSAIVFSDNTTMTLTFRPALPRERVQEVKGYHELYQRVVWSGLTGFVSVDALRKLEEERRKPKVEPQAAVATA